MAKVLKTSEEWQKLKRVGKFGKPDDLIFALGYNKALEDIKAEGGIGQ